MAPLNSNMVAYGKESLPLKLGNIGLSCYILEDGQRVLSKNSIQKALAYDGKSENWLFEFLIHVNRLTPVDPILLESLGKDILFRMPDADAANLHYGTEPKLFVDSCMAIISANKQGFLYLSELKFAKAAENALKNIGAADIEKLIDFATGYELYKSNHKAILSRFMQDESGMQYPLWIKSFPDEFFETVFSFRGWKWEDLNKNAGRISHHINDMVFARIDDVLLDELESSKPKMKYRKQNIPEQYLEHPKLKAHILALSALIHASGENRTIFEQLVNKSFPKKREKTIPNTAKNENGKNTPSIKLSAFDENLKVALMSKKNNKP